MAALPHMPLYPSDYLADTAHLSTVEHGAYLLLIMSYWTKGEALPDSDARLARITRLSEAEWLGVRDIVAEFFTVADGVWTHARIERELDKARQKVDQARNAGRASAERRSNGRSTDVEHPLNGRANEKPTNQNQNQNQTSPNGEDTPPTPQMLTELLDAWNRMAGMTGGVVKTAKALNDKRRAGLRARLKEHSIDEIKRAIASIPASEFLTGHNDKGWIANFDWLLQSSSMMKLIEGAYHGRRGKKSGWLG